MAYLDFVKKFVGWSSKKGIEVYASQLDELFNKIKEVYKSERDAENPDLYHLTRGSILLSDKEPRIRLIGNSKRDILLTIIDTYDKGIELPWIPEKVVRGY